MLKKPGWVLDFCHRDAGRPSSTLGRACCSCQRSPNWRQLNRADLSAALNQSSRISLVLTALLIQTPTSTHKDAEQKKPSPILTSLFFHPEHLLEKEKKKSRRLQARKKKRLSQRKAKDKGRQMDGIKQRRGEKLERFEALYIFIWQLHAHSRTPQTLSHLGSVEKPKYKQAWMCILAYCNRTSQIPREHLR